MRDAYHNLAEIGGFLFMVALIFAIILYSAYVLWTMWLERYEVGDDQTQDEIQGFWESNEYFG